VFRPVIRNVMHEYSYNVEIFPDSSLVPLVDNFNNLDQWLTSERYLAMKRFHLLI
jgi:hypothetical protein